jgi:hypothetical protein
MLAQYLLTGILIVITIVMFPFALMYYGFQLGVGMLDSLTGEE